MPSSSADAAGERPAGGPGAGHRPWLRLVLVVLLIAAALVGPAVDWASARFGDSARVTISVTVAPDGPASPTTGASTGTSTSPGSPAVPAAPAAPSAPAPAAPAAPASDDA